MPVFNEEEVITDFIKEINLIFNYSVEIGVIEDKSADASFQLLNELHQNGQIGYLERNAENLGHGPSTLKALRLAIDTRNKYVISVDGDGNFDVKSLLDIYEKLREGSVYVEGIRINRKDPYFRRATSLFTRILVWVATGNYPEDANTPIRGYTQSKLSELIQNIPKDSLTPNLQISRYVRSNMWNISSANIECLTRDRSEKMGTTWRSRFTIIPSRKFLRFCYLSLKQWI